MSTRACSPKVSKHSPVGRVNALAASHLLVQKQITDRRRFAFQSDRWRASLRAQLASD